jgi:hypothetical protein
MRCVSGLALEDAHLPEQEGELDGDQNLEQGGNEWKKIKKKLKKYEEIK